MKSVMLPIVCCRNVTVFFFIRRLATRYRNMSYKILQSGILGWGSRATQLLGNLGRGERI